MLYHVAFIKREYKQPRIDRLSLPTTTSIHVQRSKTNSKSQRSYVSTRYLLYLVIHVFMHTYIKERLLFVCCKR